MEVNLLACHPKNSEYKLLASGCTLARQSPRRSNTSPNPLLASSANVPQNGNFPQYNPPERRNTASWLHAIQPGPTS